MAAPAGRAILAPLYTIAPCRGRAPGQRLAPGAGRPLHPADRGRGGRRLPRTKEGLVVDAMAGELNRRIGYDFRAGFVALARLAVNVATLNPTALADAAEFAAAIKREPDSLETRAWVLVRRALGLAMARVAVD